MKGTLIVILVILLVVAAGTIAVYNSLIRKKNTVEEAFATMDVYLKKRYDLIPNLVETVKGYARHEKETLQQIIDARNAAGRAPTPAEKIESENLLSGRLGGLFALAESYPDLKANTTFVELMQQLRGVEEDIANARKYYNAAVKSFNIASMVFPASLLAGIFGFTKQPMFEVSEAAQRENVNVAF